MRILYIEDEKLLADAVIHLLKKSKIDVDWAQEGEKGLELGKKSIYDAIVLDIMLPKISGIEILQILRKNNIKTPIIMLSALSEVEDKVKALDYGADDYLAKPFKTSELIARLNAITRRPPMKISHEQHFADLTYDEDNRTLNGEPLTEKESKILEMLLATPETIQPKENILTHIWGTEAISEDNYVEVYMSYLRKKLKSINSKVKIKTIRNLGYKLTKGKNV